MSVSGNITGGNLNAAGLSLSSNVVSALNVTANIAGANITTPGLISATGNITGGNVLGGANVNATSLTGTTVSVSGNITGGNVLGGANVNSTLFTGTTVSVTGNITGGNVLVSGVTLSTNTVSAAGTVSGTSFTATSATAFTSNVSSAGMELGATSAVNTPYIDFHSSGNAATDYDSRIIASSGNIGGVNGTGTLTVNAGMLAASAAFSAGGNITGGNVIFGAGIVSGSGNITAGNINAGAGIISTTGNVSGGNILGGANVNATTHTGSTVSVSGNITGGNVLVSGVLLSTNTVSATGNITGGNLIQGTTRVYKWTTSETAPANPVPGDEWFIGSTGKRYQYWNDGTGNAWVDQSQSTSFDALAVTGNATITGTLTVSTGALSVGNITNTNANGVGNIGNSTVYFNTVFAKSTSAQYADLAEIYSADDTYSPGTVVIFGGTKEITVSDISHDTRVAGVISKDPAHLMNSAATGLPVALTGRVLCQVQGPVRKGDILVNVQSGIAGRLDPAQAAWGCVLGKSLENLSGNDVAMIEVVVGRFYWLFQRRQ